MEELTINQALNYIQTKLKAPKVKHNDFGKYNYRKAEDILEALKPLLAETKCTITITDEIKTFGTPIVADHKVLGIRYFVVSTATIANTNGTISVQGWAELEAEKKGMDAAQLSGSTSSYARKYALNGLLAIDDNKDNDDIAAQQAAQQAELMKTAVAEVNAVTTQEALNAVWAKYYGVSQQICQPGTAFYNAVKKATAKFQPASSTQAKA